MRKDIQQQYVEGEANSALFFDIFFGLCHKYGIQYNCATPKEKAFIDELTRYMYELAKAKRDGKDTNSIPKPFPLA